MYYADDGIGALAPQLCTKRSQPKHIIQINQNDFQYGLKLIIRWIKTSIDNFTDYRQFSTKIKIKSIKFMLFLLVREAEVLLYYFFNLISAESCL